MVFWDPWGICYPITAKNSKFANRPLTLLGVKGPYDVTDLGKTSECYISSLELRWEVYDPSLDRKFYGEYDGRGYRSRGWLLNSAKILGNLGPNDVIEREIAISRVWCWTERSMTPHWIGNFMENTMDEVLGLWDDFLNWLKFWAIWAWWRHQTGKMRYLQIGNYLGGRWPLIGSEILCRIRWKGLWCLRITFKFGWNFGPIWAQWRHQTGKMRYLELGNYWRGRWPLIGSEIVSRIFWVNNIIILTIRKVYYP